MARDGVANIVDRLQECGFDPRKVGRDSWESRCPAHQKRRPCALRHPRPAQSCRAEVPEQRELPAFSDRRRAGDHQRSRVRGNPRLADQPAEPRAHPGLVLFEPRRERESRTGYKSAQEDAPGIAAEVLPPGEASAETGSQAVKELTEIIPVVNSDSCDDAVVGGDANADAMLGGSLPQASSPLLVSSPAEMLTPCEQTRSTALEVHLSNITVIGQSGEKPERESSVRVLTRLASSARLFRSADGHFAPRFGSAIVSRFMGSGRRGSATG